MLKPQKKKEKVDPNSYPLIAYRVTDEKIKKRIDNEVERVTELANQKKKDNEYRYRKNQIFVEALEIGLEELGKRLAGK